MKYIVQLHQRRKGKIEIEAGSPQEAIGKVKRLIHMKRLPDNVMELSRMYVNIGCMVDQTKEV